MNNFALVSTMQYRFEQLILAIAFVAFSALCVLYMYFLSTSVVHVVISKEAETNIHKVNSDIAALEAEYMEIQNSLSREVVEQSGYISASKKIFIDRSNTSLFTQR